MPRLSNFRQLKDKLNKLMVQSRTGSKHTKVGYSAPYAMAVHEKVGMVLKGVPRPKPKKGKYWDPQGRAQAKFLEEPSRRLKNELKEFIREQLRKGIKLDIALYRAGLRLLRASQLLVPVDTGILKSSGYVKMMG